MAEFRGLLNNLTRTATLAFLLTLAGCATAPLRLGSDRDAAPPSRTIYVCDTRDATSAERNLAAAWQLEMNRKRIRAYRIDNDADAYWLERALLQPEMDLRVREMPLHRAIRRAPRSASPMISAASVTNEGFFRGLERRIPLASTIPFPNHPASPAICWIWSGPGGTALSSSRLAHLLMRPSPDVTEALAINPADVSANPLRADSLAAEVTVFRRRSITASVASRLGPSSATDYWQPMTMLIRAATGSGLRLVQSGGTDPGLSDAVLVQPGESPRQLAARIRQTVRNTTPPYVCLVADAGSVAPSLPGQVAGFLGRDWRWTTPDELIHFAQRPELMTAHEWIEQSTPFRLRLFESLHPALPMGVGLRWTATRPPRWIDLRYRVANSSAATRPLTVADEWSFALIPPVFEDGAMVYQFIAAEDSGRLVQSPAQRTMVAREDYDHDGLSSNAEFLIGSDPRNPDTDGDTLRDGEDPDPLKRDELLLSTWDFAELAEAVYGEARVHDGAVLLEGGGIDLPIPVALTAYGCRLRLVGAGGAFRVTAERGSESMELLAGRRRDNRRTPPERRECSISPEFGGSPFRLRIERDSDGITGTPYIAGLMLLGPARN